MARGVGHMTNYGKPPKDKKASIKITQPILIDWDLAKTMVECKAMKAPTVPKMEALEKWILARGWDIGIEHDKDAGLTVATITCPGIDAPITFQGSDATMALATAKAVGDAYRNGPRQSSFVDGPDGDLPEDAQTSLLDNVDVSRMLHSRPVETDRDAAGYDLDAVVDMIAQENKATADEWRFLFIVDPADMKAWHERQPADDQSIAYVAFEEGDDTYDRGWYLDSGYDYDHKLGTITERESKQIVWSRDHPAGVVQPDPPKSRAKIKRTVADASVSV